MSRRAETMTPHFRSHIVTSSHRDTPLYVPAPADSFPSYCRETEQRLDSDIGEDERAAAREWLWHVEAGRIGPHLSGGASS